MSGRKASPSTPRARLPHRARRRAPVVAVLALLISLPAVADDTTSAFKPGLVYNGAAFANLGGGVRSGGTFTSNFQPHVDIDLGKLIGWQDAIAYVDVLWMQGGLPSSFITTPRA